MTVRELYAEALKGKHFSLQLVIEFGVYEKKLFRMEDNSEILHKFFFNPKHRDYVNNHLKEYEVKRNGG
ncbi:hypothetical protein RRV45_15225 [Bacillus sp. DTU_2020_1000418_1_SI_GHA_SEK_038]|uniref:hypothetical protein n=1 Tax=Bacillus sp. DTU_2020_1000418_1_SI_GHA_SEK_038 TaxID=3077585 RepID=UPI0028EC1642|nr:hypothetical protein [Bacillus sp. DTU_2020_1000418_1_SI_GHA_SEK_038]WNS74261.1 hypothetical protein RRV45_15225 [Bacillus sp. DTU_2020_1000418_1_SI_GHA_SEK_038]